MPNATGQFAEFLKAREQKNQLRVLFCGSVDDGKSTLLGRMLYDTKSALDDQVSAAQNESRKYGTQGADIDLALLIDGLQAEREQGITIDVAYRYFETERCKFIAADVPGHEQYTRNMATGASTAELAIVLIDATRAVLPQTRRHSLILSLLGIRQVVVAINKMDLVDFDQQVYDAIVDDYRALAGELHLNAIEFVPMSARDGDNVVVASTRMDWYRGAPMLSVMEDAAAAEPEQTGVFRFPVQWTNRPTPDFRGFSGTISAGAIRPGDPVLACLSGRKTRVRSVYGPAGPLTTGIKGQSVTIVLEDEIDISRGDTLADPKDPPAVADQFAAHIVWMDAEAMLPEREYRIRIACASSTVRITDLVHRIDVNSFEHLATKTLEINEVGYCKLALDRPLVFDTYGKSRQTGSFVLIDRFTNATVGAGMIEFALRRATNIGWHNMKIDKQARARTNAQQPLVLWFTGLSGSGKSTIADRLEQKLHAMGRRTYLLDGDNIRHGLNKDLGFTDQDRVENIRRVAEISRLMVDAGLIVLVSFISPFRSERRMARDLLEDSEFVEIYVDTPLEVCEARDPKGLYEKARAGKLKNFTGIDSVYERPENPEITLSTANQDPELLAEQIFEYLSARTDPV